MELKGLHSATPWWRERKWGGKNEREGWGGGGWWEGLQKILQPFHHESLLAANDTIVIPLEH